MSDIGFGPVGDPPIIYDTERTDGYGRVTRLADRRLLEQAESRIAKLERELRPNSPLRQQADTYQRILRHPEIYRHTRECGKSMSDQIMQRIDALAAERDHWRAEAEKARTPDASTRVWLDGRNRVVFQDDDDRYHQYDLTTGHCVQTFMYTAFRDQWTPLFPAADRLESEATTDDVVEKADVREVIEHAIRDSSAGPWLQLPGPVDLTPILVTHIHEHLASAGLLRGDR